MASFFSMSGNWSIRSTLQYLPEYVSETLINIVLNRASEVLNKHLTPVVAKPSLLSIIKVASDELPKNEIEINDSPLENKKEQTSDDLSVSDYLHHETVDEVVEDFNIKANDHKKDKKMRTKKYLLDV